MINGKIVTLKPATLAQRRLIFNMGLSTAYMGARFAEDYPGGFAAFADDYEDMFFDSRAPSVCGGLIVYQEAEPVGFISYCCISYGKTYLKPGIMEIDIWMNGEHNCGRGFGNDAIVTLTDYLHEAYGVHTCIIFPEKCNHRAVCAYKKAGFTEVANEQQQRTLDALYEPEYLAKYIDELDCLHKDGTLNEDYVFMTKAY